MGGDSTDFLIFDNKYKHIEFKFSLQLEGFLSYLQQVYGL